MERLPAVFLRGESAFNRTRVLQRESWLILRYDIVMNDDDSFASNNVETIP